jgi:hypothetical protein
MTDIEFEILDQLYLTISFDKLKSILTHYSSQELIDVLKTMQMKGWIKLIDVSKDDEILCQIDWSMTDTNVRLLATKKGLFKHNSK